MVAGRVQGVGFRDAARTEALELGLTGWVRNLPYGRVEAFFSGDVIALEQMLAWCRSGPRMAAVTKVEYEWQPKKRQPAGFRIRG